MNIRLLIVETNDPVRRNLVQRLSLDQYSVFETDQPKKVKEIVKKQKIDVVLLGLIGLGHDGLSVLKTIKRVRPLTEVIMVNDSAKISLSIKGMKLGAFEDFYMPFEINTLIQAIQEAFQLKTENEKAKKTLSQRYQDFMSAVTFAEMGETDTALSFLQNKGQSPLGQKRPRNKPRNTPLKEKQNGTD